MTARRSTAGRPPIFDVLRASLDLIEVAEGEGLRVRRYQRGGPAYFDCPACRKKLSDGKPPAISRDRKTWTCIRCAASGDSIDLIAQARCVKPEVALQAACTLAGVNPSAFRDPLPAWKLREIEAATATRLRRDTRAEPAPAAPSKANAAPFLAELWRIVEDAPLSPAVDTYLRETRGIEPDAAYALGCRDWSTRRDELGALVRATPSEVLEAAGLSYDGRLWGPLGGCLRGDSAWAGIAVPAWSLGSSCPERWRWRLLAPRSTPEGGILRSMAPLGGGADLLGMGRPPRLEGPEVRLAWLGSGTPGAELAIVTEGEPDFWSTTEVVDGRAVVLSVCGGPRRWRETWPTFERLAALGVRRVAVCVHFGARGRDGKGHGEHFADAVEVQCVIAGLEFTRKLPAEGRDLNDLHRAGALRAWLADVEVNHGR